MPQEKNDNTYTAPHQAQKSQKEKTMDTSRINSLATIDITQATTLEEQVLIMQNNRENENSAFVYLDNIANYYPGKYTQNNFATAEQKEEKKKEGYITSYVGDYISNPKKEIVANLGEDVTFVQEHLKRLSILSEKDFTTEKPNTNKEISKNEILKTIEAINWFQSKVLHYNTKYGYIVPGKGTINKLVTISVEEKETKYKEYLAREKEKQKKIAEQKAKAEKEAEIERIKNEPITVENLTKTYKKLGSLEAFGKFLSDYVQYNPEFVIKAYDLMDFGESDNLTRAIMYNLKDSDIEKLPDTLDLKFYESLDAGWTVEEEYALINKLKAGKKPEAEKVVEKKKEMIERPTYENIEKVYGESGKTESLTSIKCPFPLYFNGSPVSSLRIHTKVAKSLEDALTAVLSAYGLKKLKKLRIGDDYGGTFNDRKMKGGSKKSTHAWGVAIDLNTKENQLNWGSDKALFAKEEYKKFIDIMEQYGWYNLGKYKNFDYMHFQAVKI